MSFFKKRWELLTLLLAAVATVCLSGCAASVSERGDNSQYGARQTTTRQTTNNTGPRPKAAVYIMGNPEGRDALRMAVNTFLVKSGRYQMIAVDAIDIVAKEHQRQMSGSVSDEQIAKLGFDAGAQYVCVVERTELDGYSYVATRMVSVESKVAEFADMVKLPQGGDIIEFIKWQIGSMLGMNVGPKPNSFAPQTVSASAQQPASAAQQPVNQATAPTNQSAGVDGSGTLTDSRNGKTYKTVVIGGKRWMAENLNYPTQNIGNSWCYGDNKSNCDKYGMLYDWNGARTSCPAGWHLPSLEEWNDLVTKAGGSAAGMKLKAKSGWYQNANGTDEYGFSALPGGSRDSDGRFRDVGSYGFLWTATSYRSDNACVRYMYYDRDDVVVESSYDKRYGLSARCVQD